MEEKELDKYINKHVEIFDFRNNTYQGTLYKVNDFKYKVGKLTKLAIIDYGYILEDDDGYVPYKGFHIKKIKQI